jgi:NAD(P)H-hydrate epimerase
LRKRGYEVRLASLTGVEQLKGDAAEMAKRWRGPYIPFSGESFAGVTLVIDALFGAGLSRPLEGAVGDIVRGANESGIPILAVDVPSGVHGDTGLPLDGPDGVCVKAARTVTFFP